MSPDTREIEHKTLIIEEEHLSISIYPFEDVVLVELKPTPIVSSQMPDGRRILEFDEEGDLVQIQFLEASQGVDLRGVPKPKGRDLRQHLENSNVRVLAS